MLSLEKYACESMAAIEVSNSETINLSYQIASKDWHLAEFFLTLFSLGGGIKVASFDSFETQANATKLCDFVNFVNLSGEICVTSFIVHQIYFGSNFLA